MALQFSLGLRNFLQGYGSLKRALSGGTMEIFSGAAPTSVNDAETGTKLCTITLGGNALTNEVLSYGTVTLTGGSSGSVDGITVNGVQIMSGAVNYNSSLTQTASDVADNINSFISSPDYKASASGAVITIKALPGTGATPNTYVVASTCTTITKTDAAFANGVTGVNGLTFGLVSNGALTKTGVWAGTVLATGSAGYFRIKSSVADAGAADSSGTYMRIQGTCGLVSADYTFTGTLSMAQNSIHTVGSFEIDLPAA